MDLWALPDPAIPMHCRLTQWPCVIKLLKVDLVAKSHRLPSHTVQSSHFMGKRLGLDIFPNAVAWDMELHSQLHWAWKSVL